VAALDKVVAKAEAERPVHRAEMNAEFSLRRADLRAEAAGVLVPADAIVPERPTTHRAFALAPRRAAQVAELRTTHACDVVATSSLLDDVPAVEATHPLLLPAEFVDRVDLVREKLELEAGHALVPRRPTRHANRREALWATDRRPFERVRDSVEKNQSAACHDRAEHFLLADLLQHGGLVLLPQAQRKRPTYGGVDGIAELRRADGRATTQRKQGPVGEGNPGHVDQTCSAEGVPAPEGEALAGLQACCARARDRHAVGVLGAPEHVRVR